MRSTTFPSPPELCIRFYAACRHPLIIPVRKLRPGTGKCPRCSDAVEFPPLDRDVQGVELILEQDQGLRVPCPSCQRTLQITLEGFGKRRRCPACRELIGLRLVHAHEETVRQPAPVPPAAGRGNGRGTPAAAPAVQEKPSPVDHRAAPARTREPVAPAVHENRPPADRSPEIADFGEDIPEPLVYKPKRPDDAVRSSRRRGGFYLPPRLAYWMIFLFLQLVLPVILICTGTLAAEIAPKLFFIAGLGCVMFWPGSFVMWWVARQVTALVVTTVRCPGCQEEYEAVSRWSCGCGYTDHREQHVLRFRCPLCRKRTGWFDCQRCGATIIV